MDEEGRESMKLAYDQNDFRFKNLASYNKSQ